MTACPLPRARFVTHIRRFPSEYDDSCAYCTCTRTRSYPHSRGGRANLNPRMLRYVTIRFLFRLPPNGLAFAIFVKSFYAGYSSRSSLVAPLYSPHWSSDTFRIPPDATLTNSPPGADRSFDRLQNVLVVHELHPSHSLSGTIQAGTSVPAVAVERHMLGCRHFC